MILLAELLLGYCDGASGASQESNTRYFLVCLLCVTSFCTAGLTSLGMCTREASAVHHAFKTPSSEGCAESKLVTNGMSCARATATPAGFLAFGVAGLRSTTEAHLSTQSDRSVCGRQNWATHVCHTCLTAPQNIFSPPLCPPCPAGNLNSNGQQLLVYGRHFGNVFIGVQPTFGYEGDPMRLLFSRSASPHHGFAAYYTYLEKVFKVGRHCHPAAKLSRTPGLRML